AGPGRVAGGDHDADRVADVGGGEDVVVSGGAADVRAVRPARAASLPPVAEGDRLRPTPAAGLGVETLPLLGGAGDRGRGGIRGRRRIRGRDDAAGEHGEGED